MDDVKLRELAEDALGPDVDFGVYAVGAGHMVVAKTSDRFISTCPRIEVFVSDADETEAREAAAHLFQRLAVET